MPGDRVALHVSTTAPEWDLEIGRDGLIYQPLLCESGLSAQHHEAPEDCSVIGCGWPVAYEFTIPEDWPPGGYLVILQRVLESRVREQLDALDELRISLG